MILGHLACADVARRTIFKTESLPVLVIAAFLPDLMDKMANALFSLPGRGAGHSLLFFVATMTAGLLIGPRLGLERKLLLPLSVLWLTHLVGDLVVPKVLFWPFLGPLDPAERFSFLHSFYNLYVARLWPEMLVLDLACVVGALSLRLVQWPRPVPVRATGTDVRPGIHCPSDRLDAGSTPAPAGSDSPPCSCEQGAAIQDT
ncbi:MAG: metal-dependent hydrolase [Thermodesulfobacteriota bacterium]